MSLYMSKYLIVGNLMHWLKFISFLLSCRSKRFVSLTRGAVGWSVVCDYDIYWSYSYESRHEIFNNVVCTTSKFSDQPAHTRSLIRAFASRWTML